MTDSIEREMPLHAGAAKAAVTLLANVANSNFVSDYGIKAAYGLRDYELDIAADIYTAMFGRDATEADVQIIKDELDKIHSFKIAETEQ